MDAGALGYLVGAVLITLVVAYVILAIFLIKPLRKYKRIGLVIAAVITGLITLSGASVSGAAILNWLGWAMAMSFIAWRATRE